MADSPQTKIREYLPDFIYNIGEIKYSAEGIDKEIKKLWDAEVLRYKNRFIDSADESGLAVYERMLGITPDPGEDLEDRRAYAKMMWNFSVPFSERYFLDFLKGLCGEDFTYSKDASKCEVYISIGLLTKSITSAIEDMIKRILPAHELCVISRRYTAYGSIYAGGGTAFIEIYDSTDTTKVDIETEGSLYYGAASSGTALMTFTDTATRDYSSSKKMSGAGALSYTELVNLTRKD